MKVYGIISTRCDVLRRILILASVLSRQNGWAQLENERATRFSSRCPVFSPLWPILQIIMSRAVLVVLYMQSSLANGTQNRERSNQSMDVFKPLKRSPSFRIIPFFGIVISEPRPFGAHFSAMPDVVANANLTQTLRCSFSLRWEIEADWPWRKDGEEGLFCDLRREI